MSQLCQIDANQVTRTVYNPATLGLGTSPVYVPCTVLFNAIPASTSSTSSAIFFLPYNVMGAVASWAGIDGATGTLQFQGSNDLVNWANIGSAYTITTASGTDPFALNMTADPFQYIQVVYAHGTNTTGTITLTYVLKA